LPRQPSRRLAAVPQPERDRAVAYIRVSAVGGRDAEQFHSPDLQHHAIVDLLHRRGLREVARIEDIDRTGRDFNRAGIQQVLAMARARQVDVVALYDLSRLGRNTGETLRVITDLHDLGVAVASTAEQIDDSPEGQFMLTQFLSMAQLYSDQMGRRWRHAHEHMAREGRQVGQPPIGYRQTDTGRVTARGRAVHRGPMAVDPVLGPAVTRAFHDYAAGVRVREIATTLSDLRGRPIWPAQVRAMLRRPFYRGLVTYKGALYPGTHQPLVDERTWEACQRRIAADAKESPRRLQVAHALSGLAACDACGSSAVLRSTYEGGQYRAGDPPRRSRPGAKRVTRLGCPRQSDLRACTGCGAMPAAEVETVVLDQLATYLRRLRVDDREQAGRRARQAQARADATHLRAEIRRTRAARSRLAVDLAHRIIPAEVYKDADGELSEAEQRLSRALAAAESQEGLAPRRAANASAELLRLWPDATVPERNRMLRAVVASVRLRPSAYYRQPASERVEVVPL
jgi:site-specific DNA recombinase